MKKLPAFSALVAIVVISAPLAFVASPACAISESDSPAAVLLGCRGEVVVVKSGGDRVKGTFGMSLEAGDEVRTGGDSQAEIHFDNGQWVQIGANSSTQVHGRKAQSAAGTDMGEKSFQVVQNFLKLKDSQGTSSLARLRSGEKLKTIRLDSPLQTRIRDAGPTFRWSVSDTTMALRLTLYDDQGILWKNDLPAGTIELAYPSRAPVLEPGVSYSWVLETTDPLVFPVLRSEAAFFEILSSEERTALDAALSGIAAGSQPGASTYHVFCASVYFDHGLMEEAITETAKAIELDAENPDLHAILARLYAEAGRAQEALKEYDQILEKR